MKYRAAQTQNSGYVSQSDCSSHGMELDLWSAKACGPGHMDGLSNGILYLDQKERYSLDWKMYDSGAYKDKSQRQNVLSSCPLLFQPQQHQKTAVAKKSRRCNEMTLTQPCTPLLILSSKANVQVLGPVPAKHLGPYSGTTQNSTLKSLRQFMELNLHCVSDGIKVCFLSICVVLVLVMQIICWGCFTRTCALLIDLIDYSEQKKPQNSGDLPLWLAHEPCSEHGHQWSCRIRAFAAELHMPNGTENCILGLRDSFLTI